MARIVLDIDNGIEVAKNEQEVEAVIVGL